MKLSKVGKVWEIRKRIIGGKKSLLQATAVTDPVSGKLVVSKSKIKEITLKYCKATLTSNLPHKDYEEGILAKKANLQAEFLKCTDKFEIRKETFDYIISKFKKSRKRNYDFLVRAGIGFQNSVFKFC